MRRGNRAARKTLLASAAKAALPIAARRVRVQAVTSARSTSCSDARALPFVDLGAIGGADARGSGVDVAEQDRLEALAAARAASSLRVLAADGPLLDHLEVVVERGRAESPGPRLRAQRRGKLERRARRGASAPSVSSVRASCAAVSGSRATASNAGAKARQSDSARSSPAANAWPPKRAITPGRALRHEVERVAQMEARDRAARALAARRRRRAQKRSPGGGSGP